MNGRYGQGLVSNYYFVANTCQRNLTLTILYLCLVNKGSTLQTSCNSCDGVADCNYHGTCTEGDCECYTEDIAGLTVSRYTGTHVSFSRVIWCMVC